MAKTELGLDQNFEESLSIAEIPEAAFYFARAIHEELNVKSRKTIIPQGKLKNSVIQAYQRVIDTWPDTEWAIESGKIVGGISR